MFLNVLETVSTGIHLDHMGTTINDTKDHGPPLLFIRVDSCLFEGGCSEACVDHRDLLFDLLVQRAAAGTDLDAPVALSRCAGFRSQHRLRGCGCGV